MKTKIEITRDWLPRYTGTEISEFGEYILLTNFSNYLSKFAKRFDCEIKGKGGSHADCHKHQGTEHHKFWNRLCECGYDHGPVDCL